MLSDRKPRVLLTGASGYIASKLLAMNPDWDVVRCDLAGSNLEYQGCYTGLPSNILEKVEYVLHLADLKLPEMNSENIEVNIRRHQDFISKCRKSGKIKKFIFCSSGSVYGQSDLLVDETADVNLTTFYSRSKYATEEAVRISGLNYCIFRFGTAYGSSPQMRMDLFINALAFAILRNKKFDVYDAKSYRPFIHCHDFARVLAGSLEERYQGLYNIAQCNISKQEILSIMSVYQPSLTKLVSIKDDQKDTRNYRVQSSRYMESGFQFHYDIEKGIKDLYDLFQISYRA